MFRQGGSMICLAQRRQERKYLKGRLRLRHACAGGTAGLRPSTGLSRSSGHRRQGRCSCACSALTSSWPWLPREMQRRGRGATGSRQATELAEASEPHTAERLVIRRGD
jgi:hypothetical protein